VHDLGFIFWPTWKRWYDASGDPAHNRVVVEAGRTLAGRFQGPGGYLCSFQGPHSLYIDIMMNVGLVFYAAAQDGDERLHQIARQHCLTTRRRLVRGDGSTAHEGLFDPASGEFLSQSTRQGWRGDSTWVRGLAWALYGFTEAYQFTDDARFLETARLIAGYYLEHTPPGAIPPNDWDEPDPQVPFESSAAAIAACGLVRLSRCEGDQIRSQAYQQAAVQTLDTLLSPEFLASETPGWEGILKHGIYHLPARAGVDESLIWGDYYLLEAMSLVTPEL
jgi:unsaturated chondroitin disaccharide hydrolase